MLTEAQERFTNEMNELSEEFLGHNKIPVRELAALIPIGERDNVEPYTDLLKFEEAVNTLKIEHVKKGTMTHDQGEHWADMLITEISDSFLFAFFA